MSIQESIDPQFEALLDFLRVSRGFDFTGYKRSSLMRRVLKRCQALGLGRWTDYLDYLQVHPDEFSLLFNTILINVTSFFRDKAAWDYLRTDVIPRILAVKGLSDPIRVWSAGCASGEEAYSVAMLFAEHLGMDEFRQRVKIYATDMDSNALNQARQAIYSPETITDVPEELRDKYFAQTSNGDYLITGGLRQAVIFGEHDLVQDAPISRLDLLLCRNTIMYFNSETQGRILVRFHFALNAHGVLFLGKAEMLLTHANIFTPIEMRHRFFTKVVSAEIGDRFLTTSLINDEQISNRLGRLIHMRDLAFNSSPHAQVIIDLNGILISANDKARKLFSLSNKDIGVPLNDLEMSYQPVPLRPLIDRALADLQPVMVPSVEMYSKNGEYAYLDVYTIPLEDDGNHMIGISISFLDISHNKRLEDQLKSSSNELASTNEMLQSSNEELETTNEELQSTVEELETTNEELQSSNEELETMNEELQSTNEELETINVELSLRTSQLDTSRSFLETILGNLKVGVVVVDREFCILNWNNMAEDLWGLRSAEILNTSLLSLDIGLPVEKLKNPIRTVLEDKGEVQIIDLPAVNRRGKSILCHVTCTPFTGGTMERRGVVLMMEELPSEDKHA
jgi:two-component system CheB/CheR fusion protein